MEMDWGIGKMGKTLVVAEKPSVAKELARVLKCRKSGEGCLVGEDYIVTWALGHLVGLKEPEEIDERWAHWSLKALPILPEEIPCKVLPKTRKQYSAIKKLMLSDEVTDLICATDSGREGELIFRLIYNQAGCRKPFRRLWVSAMTDAALREGLKNLREGHEYDALYQSARCRAQADYLVGMNFTRAYTVRYRSLLSVGRVQTPTLAILVKRQREIDAFVSQDYWEVEADFGDYKGTYQTAQGESRLFEEALAQKVRDAVAGKAAVILRADYKEGSRAAPLLYDLTDLQRDCNRRFGFSAARTLRAAQALYERYKMITYPRTDSRYLNRAMIPKLPGTLARLTFGAYESFARQALALPKLPITGRLVNDKRVHDHHAIIPTDTTPHPERLEGDAAKVYDLIVRRFIMAFMPPERYETTEILTRAAGEYDFLTKGRRTLERGWRALEPPRKREVEPVELPRVQAGEAREVTDAQVLQKATQPPQPHTEDSLLSAMENAGRELADEELREQMKDSGLGTPATRAAIIERLIAVEYVTRKGRALNPTEKGKKLIEIAPAELTSPEVTGRWEKELSRMARGEAAPEGFMAGIEGYVRAVVEDMIAHPVKMQFPKKEKSPKEKEAAEKRKAPKETLGKCTLCGEGEILENSKAYYCTNWKEKGCKFTIWKNALGGEGVRTITPLMMKKLLCGQKVTLTRGTVSLVSPEGGLDFALKPGMEPAPPRKAPARRRYARRGARTKK